MSPATIKHVPIVRITTTFPPEVSLIPIQAPGVTGLETIQMGHTTMDMERP